MWDIDITVVYFLRLHKTPPQTLYSCYFLIVFLYFWFDLYHCYDDLISPGDE